MGNIAKDDDELLNEYALGPNEIYRQLAEKLKHIAFLRQGNAVVGINYQVTPLTNVLSDEGHAETAQARYKITCTGNVVLIIGQNKVK